jgi:uncharacterized protein (DUF433 family)
VMATAESFELGRGIYALVELQRYVAYQQRRVVGVGSVRYWVTHALTASRHVTRRPDYTFHDLVSLFVVGELVEAGVQPHVIRDAEEHLQRSLRIDRPFAAIEVFTDGVDVLYEADPLVEDQITAANREGQEVLRPAIQAALRGIRYEAGTAAAWDPYHGREGHALVTVDPRIQFGEPCVAGTRVQTSALWSQVRAGDSEAEVAAVYELPLEAVSAAVEFEDELAALTS